MSYKHLTLNDRNKMEVLHQQGYSSRGISKILSVHHSTITRELHSCKNKYLANNAQKDRDIKASFKERKRNKRKK